MYAGPLLQTKTDRAIDARPVKQHAYKEALPFRLPLCD